MYFFLKNLDDGIKCNLRKVVGDTKQRTVVDKLEGRAVLQRGLNRLEK